MALQDNTEQKQKACLYLALIPGSPEKAKGRQAGIFNPRRALGYLSCMSVSLSFTTFYASTRNQGKK